MATRAQFTDMQQAATAALAGDARITIVSVKTGARFTYRIERAERAKPERPGARPWFVSVLTSSDNDTGYSYMAMLPHDQPDLVRWTKASKVKPETPSARAFVWAWARIMSGQAHPDLEVWHEGRCCRCGRTLTVPASIELGLGPECAERVSGA